MPILFIIKSIFILYSHIVLLLLYLWNNLFLSLYATFLSILTDVTRGLWYYLDLKSTLSSHVDDLVSIVAMFIIRDLPNYLYLRILIFSMYWFSDWFIVFLGCWKVVDLRSICKECILVSVISWVCIFFGPFLSLSFLTVMQRAALPRHGISTITFLSHNRPRDHNYLRTYSEIEIKGIFMLNLTFSSVLLVTERWLT